MPNAATIDAATLSPLTLFLQADPVVKSVLLLLALASIATWTVILGQSQKLARTRRQAAAFERDFAEMKDVDGFARDHEASTLPSARVFRAGLDEFRASTRGKTIDRDGTRSRLATTMGAAVAHEVDALGERLNLLATIGSVAPFVGLFGTVWGIMRSFTGIAAAQNTSLAVVAPGIAEALFATALGLFAAIPAVIAYNRFSHRLNRIEAQLGRFADGFHTTLSRELDLAA